MDNEIKDLNSTLLEIYQKNLKMLEDKFAPLYERISKLSNDIENGTYKEVYTLEYTDGYFDILNHENNGYFYNINSFKDADERAKVASFNTTNSLDLLRKNPNTGKLLNAELYKDVAPIIDHINNRVNFNIVEFRKIFKMVYIGTGLGLHIQQIDKKIDSLTTLVIEEELEIFRLSLFVTDYTVFEEGSRKLFLSIENSEMERKNILHHFTGFHKYMNYNIKYNMLLANNGHIKEELIQYYQNNFIGAFPYKLILQNLERLVGFVNNKDRFLNTTKIHKEKIFEDKQVLIIAAGPSLDGYIKWIAKHQDKFIIIAVDVIVKKLEKYNIIPQVVVSIDPSHLCAEYMTTEDPNFLNDTSFVLLSQQEKSVMDMMKGKHYYFSQVLNLIPEIGSLGSVPNVGTFSFNIAVYLGAKDIYIIGNDAAFDAKTGNNYSDGTTVQYQHKIDVKEENSVTEILSSDIIEVKGNLQDTVKTNRALLSFKDNYEDSMEMFKENEDLKVYNLSNGVYIEGMIPCTKKELTKKITNFDTISTNLIKEFDTISQVIESIEAQKDIRIITNIIARIKKFEKTTMGSKDDFLQNKLDIMIWILEKTKEMNTILYGDIFLEFTALVDIYVNYLLNLRQKNLHTKDEINKVSKMWAKGALVMFKDIKNALNQK